MKKTSLLLATYLSLSLLPVNAALLNVQVLGHAANSKGESDEAPPAYSGAGVFGNERDFWNGMKAEAFAQPLKIVRPRQLFAADGKTPTAVRLKFRGFVAADHWPASEGAPITNALMNSYLTAGAGAAVIIEGLKPEARYDLCLFGNNSHAGAGARFTVTGAAPQSTQGTAGPVFSQGVDYVQFSGVAADKEGRIQVQVAPSSFPVAILNGFQLRGEFPAVAADSMLPEPGSWALKAWLKAEDLARAGLKPGEPVTDWKDSAWGIRFAPNPKPPCNDKAPRFAEFSVPGHFRSVPVVRFDGQASLRQLDLLDVSDEEMTAYVVYCGESGVAAGWKQVLARRNGALCTYDGGIATPLNPRLIYTAYQETGLRIGAIDTLPMALTGHQGDLNPDERFKGCIAEVIVFGRLFGPEDDQRELVENYIQEKYFEPATNVPAPRAPWTRPPGSTSEAPAVAKQAGVKPVSARAGESQPGLSQVSVFTLANPQNATNFEYAAGDFTLPFSYTVKTSTVPRPACLDFAGQANPDCCHIFLRMDGELWMFRIDWIADKGRPSRYRGPDLDHMTRVEDGTYPPEVGLGWFLGGMWYNAAERKLYAPVHIEQEGSYRFHPAYGWFSRKIGLATSTDKGKTWKYHGDILTPETYFFNRDVYKFSGTDACNGLCDFGFYLDARGGQAYIYPLESWYPKGQWGAVWAPRVARCALSDKLAPGKWRFFYDGAWEQPALGGKSTIVGACHYWGIIYSTTLKKYICVAPFNKDPWWPPHEYNVDGLVIGACTDLSKQDWVWGHCPEAAQGFMKLFNAEGTELEVCGDTFRFYSYFAGNSFQRLDFTLSDKPMTVNNSMPRFGFEPHPESSDPILSRKTRIVGSASKEMIYKGNWSDKRDEDSYEGRFKQSEAAGSSVEFSFTGSDIYWRAVRSPHSGKADVFLDGVLRQTVDCYNPRSTSCEMFVYIKTGLDPSRPHTIKVVAKGERNLKSTGAVIEHIAFEHSAESYKASAGFCSLMGKNQWHYQQSKNGTNTDLRFTPRDDVFVKDWVGQDACRIGNNYQLAGRDSQAVRKWVAPHAGTVRVEGRVLLATNSETAVLAQVLHNETELWRSTFLSCTQPAPHDLSVNVEQDDAISFVVGIKPTSETGLKATNSEALWDPAVTYTRSMPAVWRPNAPGNKNLAFNKYARSKMLVYTYQSFKAVDGDPETAFAVYADDKISSGDDWLQLDLEEKCMIDGYVVVSKPAEANWRPAAFTLQKSEDGFVWTDVDSVTGNARERCERSVPAFAARYVRLYLPAGKPFSINEFELYYTGHKTK